MCKSTLVLIYFWKSSLELISVGSAEAVDRACWWVEEQFWKNKSIKGLATSNRANNKLLLFATYGLLTLV